MKFLSKIFFSPFQGSKFSYPQSISFFSSKGKPSSLKLASVAVASGFGIATTYYFLNDSEKYLMPEAYCEAKEKSKLVILGSGWASTAMLKGLDADNFDITVISPTNYFLFTPLLPSAIVGTIEFRSLIESMRKICAPLGASFLEGRAVDIDIKNNTLKVLSNEGEQFEVPYDRLVVAVGAEVNTFGISGVKEHTYFLKNMADAIGIRNKIIENFERASLPSTSTEERRRLLSFVVVGGGPTGVEAAAEICDFFQEDIFRFYPKINTDEVSITILEGLDRLLNTYDSKISEYTEKVFKRQNIDVVKKAMVTEVNKNLVKFKDLSTSEIIEKPFGLCIWSTGIGTNPFITRLKEQIHLQKKNRSLITDSHLKVKGVDGKPIYALGDCATIDVPKIVSYGRDWFEKADKNNDKKLSFEEFDELVEEVEHTNPQIGLHFRYVRDLFQKYDQDKDGSLSLEDFTGLLTDIEKKLKTLPATAQVASQQGKYLARNLNEFEENGISYDDENKLPPFRYRHLGSLVYIGEDQAAIDLGNKLNINGYGAYWLWRSIYLSEQISLRTRFFVGLDWIKKSIFGRDLSKTV